MSYFRPPCTYTSIALHHQHIELAAQLQGPGLQPESGGGAHATATYYQDSAAPGKDIALRLAT